MGADLIEAKCLTEEQTSALTHTMSSLKGIAETDL
jgi:hypothetical protein